MVKGKNTVQIITAIFVLIYGLYFIGGAWLWGDIAGYSGDYVSLSVIAGITIVLGISLGLLLRCFHKGGGNQLPLVLEGILLILLIGAGVYFANYFMPAETSLLETSKTDMIFQLAYVKPEYELPFITHGIDTVLVSLLHGIFYLLGNHYVIGLYLQVLFQLAGSCILFLTVRKLLGPIPGLLIAVQGIFGTLCSLHIPLTVDSFFYFLFAIGMLLCYLSGADKIRWFSAIFAGIYIGVLTNLDIFGILLLPFLLYMILRHSDVAQGTRALVAMFTLIAAVGAFFVTVLVDSLVTGARFMRVVLLWGNMYYPKLPEKWFGLTNLPYEAYMALMMALLLFVFGIVQLFNVKYTKPVFQIFGIMLLLCHGLLLFEMNTESFSGISLFFVMMGLLISSLAGKYEEPALVPATEPAPEQILDEGIFVAPEETTNTEAFEGTSEEVTEAETLEENSEKIIEAEVLAVVSEEAAEAEAEALDNTSEEIMQESADEIEFIENPLPVPKKHVSKTLDFDIDVSDDDDFDYF